MTCNNLVESISVNDGTWSFSLAMPFSEPASSWTATVTFSTLIGSLSSSDPALVITQGTTEFQISKNAADVVQCTGSATTLSLVATGVTSATAITAVTVNGQTACTGGTRIF